MSEEKQVGVEEEAPTDEEVVNTESKEVDYEQDTDAGPGRKAVKREGSEKKSKQTRAKKAKDQPRRPLSACE